MEAPSTIRRILSGCMIEVPDYQRAYSWDQKQTSQFIADLDDYINTKVASHYYFGHFLFEQCERIDQFYIIDGQQRLTTIEIFLSAAYKVLNNKEYQLSDELIEIKEDMVKRNSTYHFSTVKYDNQFFRDYVIDDVSSITSNHPSVSERRIRKAFDSFSRFLKGCTEDKIAAYIKCIAYATCTTHVVTDKAEAIQIFVFQNNRGMQPTKIEISKAEFMYTVHISSLPDDEKNNLLKEIEERFGVIYKAISRIENRISEDDILLYSLRDYFNTLKIDESSQKIA